MGMTGSMNRFLPNFISSLSTRRQVRISDLLSEATLGKDQLDLIANKLLAITDAAPLLLTPVLPDSSITASGFQQNLRDVFSRLVEMYQMSNLISLLLDSHQKILGSDIKALEDQLVAMEKAVQNFGFLLSDNNTYNYAYIESFNDERGRDSFPWPIPDRSSLVFAPTEQATVRFGEGCLVLSEELRINYAIVATILKGNASACVTNDTGIANSTIATSTTGWRATYATPQPISSWLPESPGLTGAQVLIEYRLSQASPVSEIKLVPFADLPLQVIQVTTYASDDDASTNLLPDPVTLDRPLTLHFPMGPVARFRVLLNQPAYVRTSVQDNLTEKTYQDLLQNLLTNQKGAQRPVSTLESDDDFSSEISSMALSDRALPDTALSLFQSALGNTGLSNYTPLESKVIEFVTKSQPWQGILRDAGIDQRSSMGPLGDIFGAIALPPATVMPAPRPDIPIFSYRYSLGLMYVMIGTDDITFKGVFVSKAIPSDGDMGEVRLKATDEDYQLPITDRDSSVLTSIEYSVSNQSNPQQEKDWTPILPVGVSLTEAERLLPDMSGICHIRFLAATQQSLNVFKNGYNLTGYTVLNDPSGNYVNGIQIPVSLYSADDILTIRYFPSSGQDTIDFASQGFSDAPLISSHDNIGAGEGFTGTLGRNSIDLSFAPYIDPSQVTFPTYQPITVILQDGTIATNLTNYTGGVQASLPRAGGYYYIHSNNILMFNQPVTQALRVYYQYLQNNVRVRVVLRTNSVSFVSPKVHSFQLKAKTRRSNVLGNSL